MSATTTHAAQRATPSGTNSIQQRFLRDVEQRARIVRGFVRRTVGYENDALNLTQAARLAEDRESFGRLPPGQLARRFEDWFRDVLRDELLAVSAMTAVRAGEHWTSQYIREAYLQAWQQATGRLMQTGVSTSVMEPQAVIQLPVPKRQLRRLYQRAYSNLEDITDDMGQTIREELTRGLARGENPRTMASRLNGEIENITNSRLQTLARTEVIHSHTEATLDRYERAGVDLVQHGEWASADDDRVCPICSFLDGNEYPIPEFRTGSFQFDPSEDEPDHLAGEYPLSPPTHPNCRCTILPVVG